MLTNPQLKKGSKTQKHLYILTTVSVIYSCLILESILNQTVWVSYDLNQDEMLKSEPLLEIWSGWSKRQSHEPCAVGLTQINEEVGRKMVL